MTRLSTTSLLASLAILGITIKAHAAPVQLHSRFPHTARALVTDFAAASQCSDTQVVDGLLSSAQTLLDQIIADNSNTNQKDNTDQGDSAIANDLTTLKGFLSAASELEGAIAAACGSAGSNNGTDADAGNSTDASGAGNNSTSIDNSDDNSNLNATVVDTGDSKNNTTSSSEPLNNGGTETGDSDNSNNSTAGSGGSDNDTSADSKSGKSGDSKKVVQTGSNKVIKLRSLW
ncbi:hypothetical protein C8R46DRAFT_1128196 [Mycena filopes]|nr:hypothetical protein C8R46DRAFT_1128196 [Mycena filopes]